MFSFLKGVSLVNLVAVAGFGAAIFGAFLGWILFPILVSFNVDKVHICLYIKSKNSMESTLGNPNIDDCCFICYPFPVRWTLLMLTANSDRRRNRTIWAMGRYPTAITLQGLHIQCDKSKGDTWWCHTKRQGDRTVHLSVNISLTVANGMDHLKAEKLLFLFNSGNIVIK